MQVHRTNNGKRIPQFTCSAYGKQPVGSLCPTQHRVEAGVVMTLVKETLREIINFSKEDEEGFIRTVQEAVNDQQSAESSAQTVRLETCKQRADELEKLMCKIYEDNALGKLPDKRYQVLDRQYAEEQAKLEAEIKTLEELVGESAKEKKSAGKFIALVKKYQDFEELTTPMLIEFVEKILVHERKYKGRVDSPQTIEIYFNFIGQFNIHEEHKPTPEEIELEARKERVKQKRHEEYLRRKSTGWQATYYWKTKRAKKEKMDAAKENLRAEDREKGIYYLPNQKKAALLQESAEAAQEGEHHEKTGTEDS